MWRSRSVRFFTILLGACLLGMTLIAAGGGLLRRFGGSSNVPDNSRRADLPRFYSATSFWNQAIRPDAEVDPDSKEMVERSVVPYADSANFANSGEWGIALAHATHETHKSKISCTQYCDTAPTEFRIPANAKPTKGSDHHLAVIDGERELDMWLAHFDVKSKKWSAGSAFIQDLDGAGVSCHEGEHCNGPVAAGFSLLGGVVRPSEFREGEIDHALALTVPRTRADFIACPATHTDGSTSSTSAIPEGARIQLDPQFDVDSQQWPEWKKIIARALQRYGAYVVDTGGSVAIRGIADMNSYEGSWASVRISISPTLSDLPWQEMRVLKITSCN
jgi:hypothetical protein